MYVYACVFQCVCFPRRLDMIVGPKTLSGRAKTFSSPSLIFYHSQGRKNATQGSECPPPAPSLTQKLHFISQSVQEYKSGYSLSFCKETTEPERLHSNHLCSPTLKIDHFVHENTENMWLQMSANVETVSTSFPLNWLLMKWKEVSYLALHDRCCNTAACWCGSCTNAVASTLPS